MRNLFLSVTVLILSGCATQDPPALAAAQLTATFELKTKVVQLAGGERVLVRASAATQKPCDADANDCNFDVYVYAKGSDGPNGTRNECAVVIPDSPYVKNGQGTDRRITWTIKPMTLGDNTNYYFPRLLLAEAVDLKFDSQVRRRNRTGRDFDEPRRDGTQKYSYRILNLDKRLKASCDLGVGDPNDMECGIGFVAVVKREVPWWLDQTCETEDPTIITSGP